ncbi:MAG: T9SS type A sorting domain-containing protein [Bacteroidetes bacterium]|nr:T9SS type A sorting domain-containing protein [Bacteroidota bacterium]
MKINNSLFFALLFVQFIFLAKTDGQITWTYNLHRGNIFGNLGPNSGRALVESQDGNILFLTDSVDYLNKSRLKLIKHDPHGYEIWRRILPQVNSLKGVDLLELPDGRIVIVGETPNDGNLYWQVRSAAGDFIAEYSYNLGGTPNHCLDAALSPSGNIVISGYRTNGGTNPYGQLILLEVTPDGAVNWSIYQNNNFGTVGSDVVFLNDGTGLLGYFNQISNTIGFQHFDGAGNILGTQDFPQIGGELMDVEALPSGGAMIAYYQNGQTGNLAKIGNNLQLEWTNLIGPGTPDFKIWNLAAYPDGGCAGIADLDEQHWFRVDANGNLIWMKYSDDLKIPPKYNTIYGEAIIVTSDNGILFSSSDEDHLNSDYPAFYFLTKTDENGQMIRNRITFQVWIDTNGNCTADGAPGEGPWQNGALYMDFFYNTGTIIELDSMGMETRDLIQRNYTPEIDQKLLGHYLPCEPFPLIQTHPYPDTFTVDTLFVVPNPPNSLLSGTVFIDNNQDGVFDSGDSTMACAKLRVGCNYPYLETTVFTDADGYYSVSAYDSSTYYVQLLTSLGNCTSSLNSNFVHVFGPTTTWDIPLTCTSAPGSLGMLQGHVQFDATNDCQPDDISDAIGNWHVELTDASDSTFTATPDNYGGFSIGLDPGSYTISVVSEGDVFDICNISDSVQIGQGQCLNLDVVAQVPNCARPFVDITVNRFRPCVNSKISVHYCNSGTDPAYNAIIQVLLDPQLSYITATLLPIAQSGDTLWFDIGTLDPFECGDIYIAAKLDCNAFVGQTHCVEAQIFPSSPCAVAASSWDGSNIELSSRCEQGQVIFTLRNTGTGDMSTPRSYIIIEDNVLLRPDEILTYQLAANTDTTIVLPAMGNTFRLETNQALGHPSGTLSATWEEGCGANPPDNFSRGFVTQLPYGDEEAFLSVFCDESVNSFDPNVKKAFPKGLGAHHFIQNTTALDYQILFQNTGTDTAYLVVVRDTLSPNLDPLSLRPGPSSHPYTFNLENGNVAVFTFENINLVDSTTNAEGSIGFVQFNIAQALGNTPGILIENNAAIYFDFNDPVITPTVFHEIPASVYYHYSDVSLCEGSEWQGTVFTADAMVMDTVHFVIFDSIYVTNIEVLPLSTTSFSATICNGESFAFGNETYSQTGVYSQVFVAQNGCDSTVMLNLTILPELASSFSRSICSGESYPFGNETYSQTGVYSQVFAAQNGCDSTVTLNLNVIPAPFFNLTQTLCPGGSLTVNGTIYDEANPSGTEVFLNGSYLGCDSTVFVQLSFNPVVSSEITTTLCSNQSLAVGGTVFDESSPSGEVVFANGSYLGCDSVVQVNLSFYPVLSGNFFAEICPNESVIVNGTTYDANNLTGIEVIPSSTTGCDSTVYVSLTLLSETISVLEATICDGETYQFGNENLNVAGNYTQVLAGVNGCDSTIHLALAVLPVLVVELDTTVLSGTAVFGVVVIADTVFTQFLMHENVCTERTITAHLLTGISSAIGNLYSLVIAPNPTSGSFTMSGKLTTGAFCEAKIMDAFGRTVVQLFDNEWIADNFSRELNLPDLPSGLYFISFATDGERQVLKLVVE